MSRARKVCSEPSCPNLQPCPQHRRKPWAGSTRRQQLPRNWNRIRATVLQRDPICTLCNFALSCEVHHKGASDDHSLTNLAGVCKPCHQQETQRQAAAARRAA